MRTEIKLRCTNCQKEIIEDFKGCYGLFVISTFQRCPHCGKIFKQTKYECVKAFGDSIYITKMSKLLIRQAVLGE